MSQQHSKPDLRTILIVTPRRPNTDLLAASSHIHTNRTMMQICALFLVLLFLTWPVPATPEDNASDPATVVRSLAKSHSDCMAGDIKRALHSSSIRIKSGFQVRDLSPKQLADPSFFTEQEAADLERLNEQGLACRQPFIEGLRRTDPNHTSLVMTLYRDADQIRGLLLAGRITWGQFNQNRLRLVEEFLPAWQAGLLALDNQAR